MNRCILILLLIAVCCNVYSQNTYPTMKSNDYISIGSKYSSNVQSINDLDILNEPYNSYQIQQPNTVGPRRAPADESWDSGSVTSDDGTVTITYTWGRSGFFEYYITYTYNGTTIKTETRLTVFGYGIEEYAKQQAKQIANEEAQSLPIGDVYIILLFVLIYFIRKYNLRYI